MYNVTQTYLDAIKAPAQEHDLFGELGNDYFSKDNIVSGTFHIQNQCTATDDVVLGSVYAGTLTATFHGITHIDRYDWVGQQIKPIFAIKNAHDVWEQVPLGIFTIKEAKHTAEGVEITAYDNMIKFDRKFDASNFRTAKKMYGYITDVCSICGVHFGMTEQEVQALPNGNTKIGIVGTKSNKELKEFGNDIDTYRDLVFWMAQTMACFATINRDGELVFRQYKDGEDADDEVTEDYRLAGAEFDDFVTNYTGIYVKNTKSGNDIYYGYDVAALQQEITETENKIVGYEEDLDEAAEKYAHGEITEAEYRRIVKNLEKKTKQAETRLQWLEDALVKAQNGEDGLFMDLGENPFLQPDGIGTQYPEMRRRILNALDVISYTPFSCSTVFGVHYDLCDIIQFTGGHATSVGETCCLMAYDYTFNGEYVMQGFGSDPSKPVIKEKTAKSANKADKNGVSGGRISVGSSVPTEGSEGDVHFTTNGDSITDEVLQEEYFSAQSSQTYPISMSNFTGDNDDGFSFDITGKPSTFGEGENCEFELQGLEVGGRYHIEFDAQVVSAPHGWVGGQWYDTVTCCGTSITLLRDNYDKNHYTLDFTYAANGKLHFFLTLADYYYFTYAFSDMIITPADDSISGASVYHNDEWKNVDYVRKVTQTQTSGTEIAEVQNSDGTKTKLYTNTPEIEANPTGAGTEDLEKLRIGSTIYDLAGGSEAIELTQAEYNALSESEKSDPKKVYYITDAGGGGGGASALSELTDVELTDLADGEILKYDATEEKWVNAEDGGSGGAIGSDMSIKHANWIATSSSAVGTTLTETLTLEAGQYLIVAHCPSASNSFDTTLYLLALKVNGSIVADSYLIEARSYGLYTYCLNLTETSEVVLVSGTSNSVTWLSQYLFRGEMDAIRLSQLSPVIYSLEEREIGVWTDGKPLYQKTYEFENVISVLGNQYTTLVSNPNLNIDSLVYGETSPTKTATFTPISVSLTNGDIQGYYTTAWSIKYLTIRYTKTTDVAGSGQYAALGVPAVHYDDTERVIGTWFGETLYRRSFVLTTAVTLSSSAWTDCDITFPSLVEIVKGTVYRPENHGAFNPSGFRCRTDNYKVGFRSPIQVDLGVGSIVTIEYTKTS